MNLEFCPNKASKEFKELAGIFGEDKAYFLWMRNKGNELDKAPNGALSKLFNTLLDEFKGDRIKALKAKAKVYSNDFFNWFGNWAEVEIEGDFGEVSKAVDENGEPLLVWHGTNKKFSIFKFGSGNNTGYGTYVDNRTGEEIPTDSAYADFFSTSKGVAASYAFLANMNDGLHKLAITQALLDGIQFEYENGYSKDPTKAHFGIAQSLEDLTGKSDIDALYDGLELLSEYDENVSKTISWIQNTLKNGKKISNNTKAVIKIRDLVVNLRNKLDEHYDPRFFGSISDWYHVIYEILSFLRTYNTDFGIKRLSKGDVPYSLIQKWKQKPLLVIEDARNKNRVFSTNEDRKNMFFDELSHLWRFKDDEYGYHIGPLNESFNNTMNLFFNPATGVGIIAEGNVFYLKGLSDVEIKKLLNRAEDLLKLQLKEYISREEVKLMSTNAEVYPVFLNMKNPLVHDYESTAKGGGYKDNKKIPFGYVAARLTRKAKLDGNDGVVYLNVQDPYIADNYGVFDPNQIKSAVANKQDIITEESGFSTTDNNIYHESFDKVSPSFVKDSFLTLAYLNKIDNNKDLTINEVVQYLSTSSTTQPFIIILKAISDKKNEKLLPAGISVRVVSGIALHGTIGNILNGHRACYDASSNIIYIDSDAYYDRGDCSNVLLHEIMHAITLSLLESNPEIKAKLETTLEIYRKNVPGSYFRHDPHSLAEFVADIWSNPTTINNLLNIPYKSQTLLGRIIDILKQLLKPFFKENTLFEKASAELVELLESTPSNRAGTSGIYYNINPTTDLIQKEYDDISNRIRNLFAELYKTFDKMPNKTTTRRRTQTQVFKTISRLKKEQSQKAIDIALETAAELLGIINQQTGAPQSSNNLYAWFVNQEQKAIPYENVTPQDLQDIYKHLIGFYRSILATIPDGSSLLLNETTRLNRQDIANQLNIIENFWKHAVEMVGEREIDNMIDNFTGLAIPQDQKENMKIVYRDWLHKNWFHGDINAFTSLFTSYGQSGNPIVKIAFHLTQYAELKTQEELLAVSTPILKQFKKVQTLGSYTNPGWQKVFWEVNKNGKPTGKWVRPINYGQYEQDLNEFIQQLNEDFDAIYGYHYVYDDLGMAKNSVTGAYAEDEEWINGLQPTYVKYLLALYRWKCEHANLKYTIDYYEERLSRPYDEVNYPEGHGLSLRTLQLYQSLLDTINYYLGLCTGEDGVPHPELPKDHGGLTNAERAALDKAYSDLEYISSPFEADGTPKVDEEYQTAMEIQTWQKYIAMELHDFDIDGALFLKELQDALDMAQLLNDPSIVTNFFKYNSDVKIDPKFLRAIFGVSENISPADVIIKQIYQKCLESLSKIKDDLYTRNIEPFKNNVQFWINYKLIVQDVDDNKEYNRLEDPVEDIEDVAEDYEVPYVDPAGNTYDIFGNLATPNTPNSDLLTWYGYIVNYYKDIAVSNNGIIPGVEDNYGNPIIFHGSDIQIMDLIRNTLFTYVHTWYDKNGNIRTKTMPLPMFTVLIPKDKKYIQHVPKGRFSKPIGSRFRNDYFVEGRGISEQPKDFYYDNSEAYNKVLKNEEVRKLYELMIQCMKDMQKVMGFNNRTFNYKLSMLNADTSALLSRGGLGAILKSATEVQNDDVDMRNIDEGIRNADGTVAFDIPLRLLQDLKDMGNLSSDVVRSVILYALMAFNYRNKKAIQDAIQTIHDNLTPDVRNRTATDYDRFSDNPTNMAPAIDDENSLKQYEAMMDSTMYGVDTGKQSKVHKEASKAQVLGRKFGNWFVRGEAVCTLGLNLLSMFAGGYDSISKLLRESIMCRYMSMVDLIKSFAYVITVLPKVIANWGDPLPNCKMVGLMQLNGLSKDYTHIFDNLNHNRFVRLANNLLMGGFSMFDYFSNMVLLRSHYRNVRFYDGDEIPKGFYTAYEMRQAFKAAGKSWVQGSLAHSMCKKSLWSAYRFDGNFLTGGRAVVKDDYISKAEADKAKNGGVGLKWSDFVTDAVKTDMRTKSLQRSALMNGMAPDNDRARYLKYIWGKIIFAMRNWYQMVTQRNLVGTDDTSVRKVVDVNKEQIKFGKTLFKPGKKVEDITDELSSKRMGWNFETNTPQEEIWKGVFRASVKVYRLLKATLLLKTDKLKSIKLSNVEKYAIRGMITLYLMLQLLFWSFIPIMNMAQEVVMPDNKKDAELSISNILKNIGDLAILWWANAHIRSYESHKAESNPLEPKTFVKTSSALFSALDHQTDLINMAEEGLGMSTHTLDETITSGSKYKYYTRGERYIQSAIGPWNNLNTSLTIPGVKYNTQWYMNMYGDAYRQLGYNFTIAGGSKSRFKRPEVKRPEIKRPKVKRPKSRRHSG